MKTVITPGQALNNFRLLLELSERNIYPEYRVAVERIASTVLGLGISESAEITRLKTSNKELVAALETAAKAIDFASRSVPTSTAAYVRLRSDLDCVNEALAAAKEVPTP